MADGRKEKQDEQQRRALRDLERATEQSETVGTSQFSRSALRARDHFLGNAEAGDDPMELWGKRIGRLLGLTFVVGLVVYLLLTYW
jgi:hypothetical protein